MIGTILRERMAIISQLVAGGSLAKASIQTSASVR
jgi:hypothetical protein